MQTYLPMHARTYACAHRHAGSQPCKLCIPREEVLIGKHVGRHLVGRGYTALGQDGSDDAGSRPPRQHESAQS
jgi:hypothetical protein